MREPETAVVRRTLMDDTESRQHNTAIRRGVLALLRRGDIPLEELCQRRKLVGGRIVLILELAIDPPDHGQRDRRLGMGAGRLGLDPGHAASSRSASGCRRTPVVSGR